MITVHDEITLETRKYEDIEYFRIGEREHFDECVYDAIDELADKWGKREYIGDLLAYLAITID